MNIEETPSGVLVGGSPITNVNDVRNLIKRLQNMEKNMATSEENNQPGNANDNEEEESNKPPDSDFGSLTLLDLETFNTLPEDTW